MDGIAGMPPLPSELTKQVLVEYDPVQYPWRTLIAEILETDVGSLEKLHLTRDGIEACSRIKPLKSSRNVFNRRWRIATSNGGIHAKAIRELTSRFCAEVCAQSLGDVDGVVVHQVLPTFRAHLAGTGKALGPRHKDCEYHHQPSEINFWIPLTPVFGSNSLHSESEPGKNDFEPFVAGNGQCIRFWGNQCQHYTLPNDTDVTRVSIDFRVILARHYIPRYISPDLEKDHNAIESTEPAVCRFEIGGWYRISASTTTSTAEVEKWLDIWSAATN